MSDDPAGRLDAGDVAIVRRDVTDGAQAEGLSCTGIARRRFLQCTGVVASGLAALRYLPAAA